MTQNNVSLDYVADQVEDKLIDAVSGLLEKKEDLYELEAVKIVSDWYKESRTDHDLSLIKLSNKIANKIIEYVIEPLIAPLVSDINIQIQKHNASIKFDSQIFKTELKPYVEFVKKINNTDIATVKIKFKIIAELQIKDAEIEYVEKVITINPGKLTGTLELFIISLATPIAQYDKPISLGKKILLVGLPSLTLKEKVKK
ncbi:MAG: hypothetical protein HY222_03890 [Thaumarchaeota archaeon]|nr:hypothetical protein [Nitrososphaerota archaeon]MBI3641516.1 hypothetical protein [Nitrososphaerota archaeon]